MIILKEHQLSAKAFLHSRQGLGGLLWHEMGLGKTLTSLFYVRERFAMLRREGIANNPKFLVIMPKSAGITWKKEVQRNASDLWPSMIMLPVSRLKQFKRYLLQHDIRVIIVDESHYLKNPEADRTQFFAEILKYLAFEGMGNFFQGKIIFLTGTPYMNNAGELFPSWAVLAARNAAEAAGRLSSAAQFEKWRGSFANRNDICFNKFDRKRKMMISVNATTWEGTNKATRHEMDALVASFTHYRSAAECLDMPEKTLVEVDLGLPDDKLLADAKLEESDFFIEQLATIAKAKTPHAIEWVKNFFEESKDRQLVIFSQFKEPILRLKELLKEHMVLVTGDEVGRQRDSNINKFQEGKVKVIGLTYGAGAESINLQNANYTLYIGYPWTWAKLAQAMARTWRQGQHKPTFHYFLLSGQSDARVLEKVMTKQNDTNDLEAAIKTLTADFMSKVSTVDDLI